MISCRTIGSRHPCTAILGLLLAWILGPAPGLCAPTEPPDRADVTLLCYMNGDNDLALEVLHALDMMETVGSSPDVNVVALVDGHPRWLAPYDAAWSRARLVRLEADPFIGRISSPVIEEWGEADLGAPATLERFVRTTLARYPARRYMFYTFAHGRGAIDTHCYDLPPSRAPKTVSISRDDSGGGQLSVEQFRDALKAGLGDAHFDLTVLFSCLANMVEVGYALSDITRLVVGSQDEIRLVNQPPGRFQIRGLHFEETIARLKIDPTADARALGRRLVDSHVIGYEKAVRLPVEAGAESVCRYAGDMALVNVAAMPKLVRALDALANGLIGRVNDPEVVGAMRTALAETQSFASFLNLEYYDLPGFVRQLRDELPHPDLKASCDRVLGVLREDVLIHARSTPDGAATGISIYLSHPLVPDNIYRTHQRLYRANVFSRDSQWDEMIQAFRPRLKNAVKGGRPIAETP